MTAVTPRRPPQAPTAERIARSGALLALLVAMGCAERRLNDAPASGASRPADRPAPPPSSSTTTSASSSSPDAAAPDLATEATFALPIPARAQAPESPPSGWCGETAIQEGILFLGLWAPQRLINKAGKPLHADLYATEIPTALTDLGVRYALYGQGRGYEPFARWTTTSLHEGDPVLAGVKILPTEHPDWGLDHFVLVMGHGEKGLLVNTTWGYREWVSDKATKGLSLKNAFYGIRLLGLKLTGSNAQRARAVLVDEGATVKLRVSCVDPKPGVTYRIEQRTNPGDRDPSWSSEVLRVEGRIEKEVTVDADRPARFQCVAVSR